MAMWRTSVFIIAVAEFFFETIAQIDRRHVARDEIGRVRVGDVLRQEPIGARRATNMRPVKSWNSGILPDIHAFASSAHELRVCEHRPVCLIGALIWREDTEKILPTSFTCD